MTRINTNVNSLIARNTLDQTNSSLQQSLTRLSTGLRINKGSDDPAGLIASESLRRDITSINKAITNSERASQFIATADSALGQISNILNDVRGLVTEAANEGVLSDEQIEANQLQIDSSLEAIDRIAKVTTFQGKKILDGSSDFIIDSKATNLEDLEIKQATIGSSGSTAVTIDITTAATQAEIAVGSAAFVGAVLTDDLTLRVSGNDGSEVFTFESGAGVADVVSAINLVSDSTGVTAAGTTDLTVTSTAYGTDAFVELEVISEGAVNGSDFQTTLGDLIDRDAGTDIVADVNGVAVTGDGNDLSINTSTLALDATITAGSTTNISFNITGGGALFQLGPKVQVAQQANIGIPSVNTGEIGGATGRLFELKSGGARALGTDNTGAADIIDEVSTKISQLRGRLGAFERTTLGSNISSLKDTLANITEAESSIRDADFAVETAALTRAQILSQSGLSVLSIANSAPQNALSLLR